MAVRLRSAVVRGRGSVSFGAALSWGSTGWICVGSAIMGLSWAVGSVAWCIGWRSARCRRPVGWASTWTAWIKLIAWSAATGGLEAIGRSSTVSTRSSTSPEVARCSSWSRHPASAWRPIAWRCGRSEVWILLYSGWCCSRRIASSLSWACRSCLRHATACEARGVNG